MTTTFTTHNAPQDGKKIAPVPVNPLLQGLEQTLIQGLVQPTAPKILTPMSLAEFAHDVQRLVYLEEDWNPADGFWELPNDPFLKRPSAKMDPLIASCQAMCIEIARIRIVDYAKFERLFKVPPCTLSSHPLHFIQSLIWQFNYADRSGKNLYEFVIHNLKETLFDRTYKHSA